MTVEIVKATMPKDVHDTKRGRVKYPFGELETADPDSAKQQPAMVVEGENECRLALISMRRYARDKKARFSVHKERNRNGKVVKITVWRVE